MGKFIVIDGIDGSGKTTQFELCKKKLRDKTEFLELSFPTYEGGASAAVKMYLSGEITKTADGVNAYAAASFYAVDRYISFKRHWEQKFTAANLVLSCRYTTSNVIHQTPKLPEAEREKYIDWLYDYEFVKLGLPKPDSVIYLNMPVEASQILLSKRYNNDSVQKDIHENDISYLNECYDAALFAAKKLDWIIIDCAKKTDSGYIFLPEEEINKIIMREIEKVNHA
ncbi:MAG: deoxynucleoside kinase [Ruminococcus sp.]|jgi:dTMP kinase|nr:deoxynucleoside kinase [Ruminococcus sp.]